MDNSREGKSSKEGKRKENLEQKKEKSEKKFSVAESDVSLEEQEKEKKDIKLSPEFEEVKDEQKKDATKKDLKTVLLKTEEELREKHESYLRTLADYQNYKKRMERERANLVKFGNEKLLKDLLPVLDNFDRALEHAHNAKSIDVILDGLEMIREEFLDKLGKFGLKMISSEGEKFDPNMHEATTQIETTKYPDNTIIEELQRGYFIHDRLLRPPKVVVSSFPSASEKDQPEED